MNKVTDDTWAKKIMGNNVIGVEEIKRMERMRLVIPDMIPEIPFSQEELRQKKDDYFLILAISKFMNGEPVTIRNIQNIYGKDPEKQEPCFYNQDWYDKESFMDMPMKDGWYLIRKNAYEESRAVQPQELIKKYRFPTAIACTYTFFVAWMSLGVRLWYHDFIWCSDTDHNGDRIYVGKYHDVDGVNRNGFSIHRHLALRQCYACIDQ